MYYMPQQMQGPDIFTDAVQRQSVSASLYRQLADKASSNEEEELLSQLADRQEAQFAYLADMYQQVTGQQPPYMRSSQEISNFETGMQQAYQFGMENAQAYWNGCQAAQGTPLQSILYQASADAFQQAEELRRLASGESRGEPRRDHGGEPYVVNIERATEDNENFRAALWTGEHLQLTLMSIEPGDDIGLEIHPDHDQFLRIEAGRGRVEMGPREDQLSYRRNVRDDYAVFVPAGVWHNLTNTGQEPLKLYSIYAPPEHPYGTVHATKAEAEEAEHHHHH
ncbi:mannose-6-phosphate isomerase-like protein (cupin superfamily) [Salsuginibacillus halophilus]|uniref:Mannose-6-phosphate isomerase-like protein (Cupin superfamily) n=1 Tax=Salsuginibacillus halophilus TaxID=517424 RepID=A0A2P8H9S2_9BACI|nr:cupin domain-containing protein [Salsuginibacillus halophilus]PSL42968.1 mannose-6-phosphate isomerase-like protein (cupin superfamily) [Salsuginibacillus halophilus]